MQVRNVLGQIGPLLARYAAPDFEADEGLSMEEYERRRLPTAATQGFDLHFLNQMNAFQGLRTGEEIMQIFRRVRHTVLIMLLLCTRLRHSLSVGSTKPCSARHLPAAVLHARR